VLPPARRIGVDRNGSAFSPPPDSRLRRIGARHRKSIVQRTTALPACKVPSKVHFILHNLQEISYKNLSNLRENVMLKKTHEESAGISKGAKREKFVILAERRTRNALKAIRVISKLGNKNAYDYSEADVKKIAAALNKEIEVMKARMSQSGGKQDVDFTL
jgi:hypothetical protein